MGSNETKLLFVSSFTIRERSGDNRTLELSGRALPHRPYELTGTQRSSLTWYPGSPIGTLQVLGAQEDQTTIRGWWKERFIKASVPENPASDQLAFATVDEEPIAEIRDLADLVDDIRRKGQLLEVTWLSIARRGIIKRFVQRWHRSQDLEYEITFEWISQAESFEDVPAIVRNQDISDLPGVFQGEVNALIEQVGDLLRRAGAPIADIIGEVNDAINDIQEAVINLEEVVLENVNLVLGAVEAAQRAASILDFLKIRARNLLSIIRDDAEAVVANSPDLFGEKMRGRSALREQKVPANSIASSAAVQQDLLIARLNPELLSTFQAREGQDLRDISTIHYGTPDEWRSLLRFNRLTSSKLVAGQTIFVPRDPPRERNC